jgi:hypothetical protein
MRKRWFVVLVALTLPGLVMVAVALWPEPIEPGITSTNFDRIRPGMTEPEVEGLLGGPGTLGPAPARHRIAYWSGKHMSVAVGFEDRGGRWRVKSRAYRACGRFFQHPWKQDGYLDRLRAWIGW